MAISAAFLYFFSKSQQELRIICKSYTQYRECKNPIVMVCKPLCILITDVGLVEDREGKSQTYSEKLGIKWLK